LKTSSSVGAGLHCSLQRAAAAAADDDDDDDDGVSAMNCLHGRASVRAVSKSFTAVILDCNSARTPLCSLSLQTFCRSCLFLLPLTLISSNYTPFISHKLTPRITTCKRCQLSLHDEDLSRKNSPST